MDQPAQPRSPHQHHLTHRCLTLLDRFRISTGLASHSIPVRHFVLHADQDTLRARIQADHLLGPSMFRFGHLEPYAHAARTWLHDAAEVVDTTHLTPTQAAEHIAGVAAHNSNS